MATTEAIVLVVVNKFAAFLTQQEAALPVGARDLVVSIRTELQTNIHPYVRDAEGGLKREEDAIKTWVAKVRDIACEAEDMLDTLITRTERRKKQTIVKRYAFIVFHDLFAGLKVLMDIKLIRTKICRVSGDRPMGLTPINPKHVEHPTPTARRYDERVFGLERDRESLIWRLTEDGPLLEQRVISIVGKGGIGKTTLAQMVYTSDRTINHFDLRAWIYVSQGYTKRGLLNDAFRKVTSSAVTEDTLLTNMEQKKKLLHEFLKKKRYLIVLDDVCDVEVWSFLQGAFPYTGNGSRVLLTTRHDSVASGVVGPRTSSSSPPPPPHIMKPLDDDSSWKFFLTMNPGRLTDDYDDDDDEVNRLWELLISELIGDGSLSERRRVIPILEIGTVKSPLAQVVYNSDTTINHFDLRAWIDVSDWYTFQTELLDETWRKITKNSIPLYIIDTMEQKKRRLYEFLENKRYLIVLDCLMDFKAWNVLQGAFPDTGNGSRVLLTTRHDRVAFGIYQKSRSAPFIIKSGNYKAEMRLVGKQIVKNCGGLPLAIKVIGSLLNRKDTLEEWLSVLNDDIWSLLGRQDPFLTLLELIYQDLHFLCRLLFLYFFIFPKEYEIPVRRLFGLWQAEEMVTTPLVDQEEIPVSLEDWAYDYLEELIDRNLIQVVRWRLDGKPKTCKIAGVVRDFLSKVCDIGIFHILHHHQNTTNSTSSSSSQPPSWSAVRRLVEYTDINDLSSLEPHIRKSRSYLSFNFRKGDLPAEVTGRFLVSVIKKGGFGLLRVLDLEQVYKPKLPESLGKLYLLKYLGLRWTFLDALPSSVGDLSFLETLDVKHTNVSHLPTSIWKLKHLQHLYLNEIHLHMSTGHHIASFGKNLQTLLGLSIDMETPIKDILYSLITFKKLGLTCQGTMDEAFVEWISTLTALETLRLRSRDGYGRPSGLKVGSFSRHSHLSNLYLVGLLSSPLSALELPQNLTVLTLSVSRLELDPMPILEKLPKLRALRLLAHSYKGKKMVCSDGGFPSLHILKLWMLEELEEWSVEKGAMANLGELEIRCCDRLKDVPQELLQLASLWALVLTNMPQAFIDEVKAKKQYHTSLSLNNLDFPTFCCTIK